MKSCCSDITLFVIYQQRAGRERYILIGVVTREAGPLTRRPEAAKLQEKKRFSRREAFINQEISARISANETEQPGLLVEMRERC